MSNQIYSVLSVMTTTIDPSPSSIGNHQAAVLLSSSTLFHSLQCTGISLSYSTMSQNSESQTAGEQEPLLGRPGDAILPEGQSLIRNLVLGI